MGLEPVIVARRRAISSAIDFEGWKEIAFASDDGDDGLQALRTTISILISPRHYTLTADLDGAAGISGSVAIDISVDLPCDEVTLDCDGPEVLSADINGSPAEVERQDGTVTLRGRLVSGTNRLTLSFRTSVSGDGRGLVRSEGSLFTQLQPSYAPRVFPCFDDPRLKATFDVHVSVPGNWTVVSNAPIADQTMTAHGLREVHFATSPPMPPYMLLIAAGTLRVSAGSGSDSPIPIRVCAPVEPERYAFAAETASRAASFFATFLETPFPWAKLDLVVVPELEVEAMESTGAITFRSAAVASTPSAAPSQRRKIATLVAHEVAHQWFGSLITPASWEDLWLSEGVATWLATKAIDDIHPDLAAAIAATADVRSAMVLDAAGGRPLHFRPASRQSVRELFDPIAYHKGAAVLRTIERHAGSDALRRTLRLLLRDHAGGSVPTDDFIVALQSQSDVEARRVLEPLLREAGVPTVRVDWAGDEVTFTRPAGVSVLPIEAKIALSSGAVAIERFLAPGGETRVRMAEPVAWVYGNAGAATYVRTECARFDEVPVELLDGTEALAMAADAFDSVWASTSDILAYLGVAEHVARDGRAADFVAQQLGDIREMLASGNRRSLFDDWVATSLHNAAAMSSGPAFVLAAAAGDHLALERAGVAVSRWLNDEGELPSGACLIVAAHRGDAALLDTFRSRITEGASAEERHRLLTALASMREPGLIPKLLELLQPGQLRGAETLLFAEGLVMNDVTRPAVWELMKERWEEIAPVQLSFGTSGAIGALGIISDPAMRNDVAGFLARQMPPGFERTRERIIGQMDHRLRFREREQRMFDCWLSWRGGDRPAADDGLSAAHTFLNSLSAAAHGALQMRVAWSQLGLSVPGWMHDPRELAAAAAAVEQRLLAVFSGDRSVDDALIPLAERMREDLLMAAGAADAIARGALSREIAVRIWAILEGRHAAATAHFLGAAIAFADLCERQPAVELRDARMRALRQIDSSRLSISSAARGETTTDPSVPAIALSAAFREEAADLATLAAAVRQRLSAADLAALRDSSTSLRLKTYTRGEAARNGG